MRSVGAAVASARGAKSEMPGGEVPCQTTDGAASQARPRRGTYELLFQQSQLPPPWMPGGGRAERGQGVEPAERSPLQAPPSQGARSALLAMPLWDGQCSVAPGRSAHVPPAPLGTSSPSSPSVQLRQSPSPSPASRPEQTTSPGGKEVGVQGASSQLLLPSRTLPLLVPALRAEPVTPPPPFPGLD